MDVSFLPLPTPTPLIGITVVDGGWSEPSAIIGIISSALTLVAVVIALISNTNAKNSLRSALRIQEQNKNIGLIDRRLSLIAEIETCATEIKQKSISEIRILYGDAITQLAENVLKKEKDLSSAKVDRDTYFYKKNGFGYYGPVVDDDSEEIIAEQRWLEHTDDQSLYQQYIDLCHKNEIYYSRNTKYEESKTYNYAEISERIHACEKLVKQERELLINAMREYVSKTIESIEQTV